MQDNNLKNISTGEPTYWPTDRNKISDVVDFGVAMGSPNNHLIDFVLIEVRSEILHRPPSATIPNKFTN
ncbi:unnamed protein product [Diabrotica balteata]|uniref:Uncharacterized protein n=1 Tax=Diabrotica balteata TaxID=107213 RepID=A0A9N9SZB8_DIABA|nr:unnamed protein product [Diabrotica balteata]